MKLREELEARGLLYQMTNEKLMKEWEQFITNLNREPEPEEAQLFEGTYNYSIDTAPGLLFRAFKAGCNISN